MRAIEASDIVLVLISRHTQLETGFLHKEIGIALERLIDLPSGVKPVIPVRLEEAGIPTSLAGIHAVDMFMPDGPKRLMDTLHRAIET